MAFLIKRRFKDPNKVQKEPYWNEVDGWWHPRAKAQVWLSKEEALLCVKKHSWDRLTVEAGYNEIVEVISEVGGHEYDGSTTPHCIGRACSETNYYQLPANHPKGWVCTGCRLLGAV